MSKIVKFPVILEVEVHENDTIAMIPDTVDYINMEIDQRLSHVQYVQLHPFKKLTPEMTKGF